MVSSCSRVSEVSSRLMMVLPRDRTTQRATAAPRARPTARPKRTTCAKAAVWDTSRPTPNRSDSAKFAVGIWAAYDRRRRAYTELGPCFRQSEVGSSDLSEPGAGDTFIRRPATQKLQVTG